MKSLLALVVLSLMFIGCAKKKKSLDAAPTPEVSDDVPVIDPPSGPFTPPGTGPGQGPGVFNGLTFDVGGSAAFDIVGSSTSQKNILLSEYTGRTMNDPQNISLNMNFVKIGDNWGGTVTTAYEENGFIYYWYFSSGSSDEAVQYNVWFDSNGKKVFHAVLEDYYFGAVVIVIDDVLDLGDGQSEDSVSGSLWFKNYGITYAPHPPTQCWFVSFRKGDTPYDCRPWPLGDLNNTYAGVNPTKTSNDARKGYKKLGTFSGLSLIKAFNGEYNN